jgi:3-hydroxyisobutyrate dehydrogenase-like beta-hydroxyacid dehydrogenase
MKEKRMKIGIIGAGNIGANAAKLFVKAGHESPSPIRAERKRSLIWSPNSAKMLRRFQSKMQ